MPLHPTDAAEVNSPDTRRSGSPRGVTAGRRRALWLLGALLLLGLLVITPPLVSANRYRVRIVDSMSRSLGRPVHLDAVSLHLLPVPGFTLRNFVVSEDPAFGAEPTIRANTVEATLRVSSLWRRPVEFSTVRFVEPSVNLVRTADGRWNLADVLLHASRVDSAPTAQQKAGPTPRFPYIEATGGRVNVKLGAEKLPFSLTDADFALWLPSPKQWRVRLVGSAARTDRNITDPGRLRIEGDLHQAAHLGEVPVSFRASWHDVPLGEATRILVGDDWGWRGSLNLDTELHGTLGAAQLTGKLTLGGLRRAEFYPSKPLDLQVTCHSGFSAHPAALNGLLCQLPDDATAPLEVRADRVALQNLEAAKWTVDAAQVPARWALLWAALFSSRVPTDLHSEGSLDLNMVHGAGVEPVIPTARGGSTLGRAARHARQNETAAVAEPSMPSGWSGTLRVILPVPGSQDEKTAEGNVLVWRITSAPSGGWPKLHLPSTPLDAGGANTVNVTADVSEDGYTVSGSGSAPPAAVLEPARFLPQLGDDLQTVLPYPASATQAASLQFTCTREWKARQTCTGPQRLGASEPVILPVVPGGESAGRQANRLAPRSLSPLDNAPFSAPLPVSQPPVTAPQP